jgi:hypothetical protein
MQSTDFVHDFRAMGVTQRRLGGISEHGPLVNQGGLSWSSTKESRIELPEMPSS